MFAIATRLALACILSAAPPIPGNISVDSALAGLVDDMLLHSPTFRAQCARLQGVTRLRIRLSIDGRGACERTGNRADSVITRYEYGFIDVTVRLRSLSHQAELIAHEFEHVLEYVEGVDHRAESRRNHREVWKVEESRFETTRAIDAGRRVAAEVARSRSARVNEPHP
jgi:hypothetical protein